MGCWKNAVSINGELSGRTRREREIILYLSSVVAVISGFMACGTLMRAGVGMGVVGGSVLCFFNTAVAIIVLCKLPVSKLVFGVCTASNALGILCIDLYFRAEDSQTAWPAFVVLIDLVLVLRMGNAFAAFVVATMVLWLCILCAERSARFGLFDIPLMDSQELRREYALKRISCETLPCPIDFWTAMVFEGSAALIFFTDFIATRGFAQQVEKEQLAMARTIRTVEEIAKLLAGYDIDTVATLLAEGEADLPDSIYAALFRIEQNLRVYRPYLPVALFEAIHQDDRQRRRLTILPPGVSTGEATFVFTDIRASTSIWEAAQDAMRRAINVHNKVVRGTMDLFAGYEVKTIGDAFMVAFDSPLAGVDFALSVQWELLQAEWPAGLFDVPICARRDSLWGGLTVRIGVNSGPVALEENTLTGRVDYLGQAVNIAARLEGLSLPGAIAIRSDLWDSVSDECLPARAGNPETVEIKGVTEPLSVRCVWPAQLGSREDHPLAEYFPTAQVTTSSSVTSSSLSGSSYPTLEMVPLSPTAHSRMRWAMATVGSVRLRYSEADGEAETGLSLSSALDAVVPLLDQSGGTLVNVLGNSVCVGWNLSRAVHADAESSLQFVRRLRRNMSHYVQSAGFASGKVLYGDIGTRTQRFLTVAGSPVYTSWRLAETAAKTGRLCLYASPPGKGLPAALRCQLMEAQDAELGVYELLDDMLSVGSSIASPDRSLSPLARSIPHSSLRNFEL